MHEQQQQPLPPGPDVAPYRQLFRWIRRPTNMLRELQAEHGDIFTLHFPLGLGEIVITSNTEAIKEMFALSPEAANAGEANQVLKPFLGQHSLLLLDGSEHLRQRKMMMPAFHGERMHAYGRTMIEMTHDSIDRWPTGRTFKIHEHTQAITLQVILRTVFGVEEGPLFAQLARLLKKGLDLAAWPGLLFPFMQKDLGRFSPWGRWVRVRDETTALIRGEIRRRRAQSNEGRSDVLAMMLEARDENGEPLSEDEIHDELVTLLVAGHETTATALAWALRWLLPNRALIERLRAEIATAHGDPGKLAKLELLDWTVKETLRLQPVVPLVGRVLKQPLQLAGWTLPAGTVIAPAIPLVHRDAKLYPSPERFDPDRFRDFKPAPWEWIPFGGGMRRCIGAAFAVYEMKMVLATILPRVDMKLAKDDIKIVRRSITLTPSGGLPVIVTQKRARTPSNGSHPRTNNGHDSATLN